MVRYAVLVIGLVLLATDLGSALDPVQMPVQLDPTAPKRRLPARHRRKRRPQKEHRAPPPRPSHEAAPAGDAHEPMLAYNVQRPMRFDPAMHPRVTAFDNNPDADVSDGSKIPTLAYNVHRPERYDPKAHPRQHPELAHELASRPQLKLKASPAPSAELKLDGGELKLEAEPAWYPTQQRMNRN